MSINLAEPAPRDRPAFTFEELNKAANKIEEGYADCICWALQRVLWEDGWEHYNGVLSRYVKTALGRFRPEIVMHSPYWWSFEKKDMEERILFLCFLATAPDSVWEY